MPRLVALEQNMHNTALSLLVPLSLILPAMGCAPADIEDDDYPYEDIVIAPQSEPAGYYSSASGKSGTALLRALSDRIRGHKALGYSQARDVLFGSVGDTDNNNIVDCIYTGRQAKNVTNTSSASSNKFNTEHTWPQSLGAAGPAKTDLHHLWPTDDMTNNRRGNFPFGVVTSVTWTAPNLNGADGSRLGRSADGRTVFEPENRSKGNIARSILYFYTRYNSDPQSGFTLSNFQSEKALLQRWHEADPPDAEERSRNDLVFGVQGNRNPYIDHPEFVRSLVGAL